MIILSRYKSFFRLWNILYPGYQGLIARFDTCTKYNERELRSEVSACHSEGKALRLRSWNKL